MGNTRTTPDAKREAMQQQIVELLMDGMSFQRACEKVGITKVTGHNWLRKFPDFQKSHDIAREIQADNSVDEILDAIDALDPQDPDFQNTYWKTRLRVESIKWVAGKQRPKKYSDKVQHEVAGTLEHQHVSKEQRDAAVRAALDNNSKS